MAAIKSHSNSPMPEKVQETPVQKTTSSRASVKKLSSTGEPAVRAVTGGGQAPAAEKVELAGPPSTKVAASAKRKTLSATLAKTVAAVNPSPEALPEPKVAKEKKQKMVRDSVTIPKAEYHVLDAMKQRAAQLQTMVKKTELIRAGIKHLSNLPDAAFLAAISAVPSLKTGRPAKS